VSESVASVHPWKNKARLVSNGGAARTGFLYVRVDFYSSHNSLRMCLNKI